VTQLSDAKREVPIAWGQITLGAGHSLQTARTLADGLVGGVLDQADRVAALARTTTAAALETVGTAARQNLRDAANRSEALIREITSQGPEKTLKRGFALVRSGDGKPVTRASQTTTDATLEIEFSDGRVSAITGKAI
jgi:exodeoxyribonuclease VII large subunit